MLLGPCKCSTGTFGHKLEALRLPGFWEKRYDGPGRWVPAAMNKTYRFTVKSVLFTLVDNVD